ncbi:MAG: hypothetical protein KME31_32230, partial [Tolypothrix carrinoi HA7290-LM1]|nr:hypothetical protein [Tolypothrix carrinoi HA7290-LM1]
KGNHPTLHEQVKDWFNQAIALNFEGITFSYDERIEKGHHRTEKRQVWTVHKFSYLRYINKLTG